jgi:predicted metal-dependent hydrolase
MEYTLIRSRRKTLSIEITPRGELLVRAPSRMSRREIRHFLESRRDWITAHLAKLEPAPEPLSAAELQLLSARAKETIPPKAAAFAAQLGVTFGRITIRAQKTRWGSCSVQGNLNFNCLLMLAPEAVLDYVIIHELCHRKQMNHSAQFWAEVERILPDYTEQRRWLKQQGANLLARLPDAQK